MTVILRWRWRVAFERKLIRKGKKSKIVNI